MGSTVTGGGYDTHFIHITSFSLNDSDALVYWKVWVRSNQDDFKKLTFMADNIEISVNLVKASTTTVYIKPLLLTNDK